MISTRSKDEADELLQAHPRRRAFFAAVFGLPFGYEERRVPEAETPPPR